MTAVPLLECRDLGVTYGDVVALHGCTFEAGRGEFVGIIGPNGSGKSSLFKSLAGFVAHSGEVFLEGVCCHREPRTRIACIPQRSDVDFEFPISVGQLVTSGRRPYHRWFQRPSAQDRLIATEALERVGLGAFEHRSLSELSGGQAQRVLIARALAQQADVLLLDEAMSGVDFAATESLVELFAELARSGALVMVSTHDLGLARHHFDRVIALNGAVIADGSPHEVLTLETLERVFGSSPHRHADD